jgi:hypothetical protein
MRPPLSVNWDKMMLSLHERDGDGKREREREREK